MAALFEQDRARLAEKITFAQQAMETRRRSLNGSVDQLEEGQALDSALVSLQALARCLLSAPPVPSSDHVA